MKVKMGKAFCLLLMSVILVSLCACGNSASSVSGAQTVTDGPSVTGAQTVTDGPSVTGAQTVTDGPSVTGMQTVTGGASASDAVAAEPVTEEKPKMEAEESFSVGATVNNTYENAYFGIGVALDDNWVFKTQEEINEINGIAQNVLDSDVYTDMLANGTVYTDMTAYADGGLVNMNITIEKLNALATLAIDEKGYIDLSMENNDFQALFAEVGLDLSVLETGSVTIADGEHPCVVMEGSAEGIGFYEKTAAIKKGNYVLCITVTSVMENVVEGVFAYFYAL